MAGCLLQQINFEGYMAEATSVFSNERLPFNPNDIQIAFKNLGQLYKLHLKCWWEIASLDTYLTKNCIQRTEDPTQTKCTGYMVT